jgi:hypothetical protein
MIAGYARFQILLANSEMSNCLLVPEERDRKLATNYLQLRRSVIRHISLLWRLLKKLLSSPIPCKVARTQKVIQ